LLNFIFHNHLEHVCHPYTTKKKTKLPTEQIPQKYSKSVSKSVVFKFTDRFFESVDKSKILIIL